MAYIALVNIIPDKEGLRRVQNVVAAPDHSTVTRDGVTTIRPDVWFAPQGYEAFLVPDNVRVACGDILEDGAFHSPPSPEEQL